MSSATTVSISSPMVAPDRLWSNTRSRYMLGSALLGFGLGRDPKSAPKDQLIGTVAPDFARQQVQTVDFATSNVRGAPFDLYIAGARIEGNFPIGPMAGTAFNLTTLSFGGHLDMGCVVDSAAIDDPALLRSCLVDAYDELLAFA